MGDEAEGFELRIERPRDCAGLVWKLTRWRKLFDQSIFQRSGNGQCHNGRFQLRKDLVAR